MSVTLQACTRAAVDELRNIRCSDPAATRALDAVRLTIYTLEHWWLPELARGSPTPQRCPAPASNDLSSSQHGVPDTGDAEQRCQAPGRSTSSARATRVPGTLTLVSDDAGWRHVFQRQPAEQPGEAVVLG